MNRYEKRRYQDGSKIQPSDLNDMPRRAVESIRSTSNTRVNRLGDNVTIKNTGDIVRAAGGLNVAIVTELPAIPASGAKFVFWTSADGGTGDNQIWVAFKGQTKYYPLQFYTTNSGIPL